MVGEGVVLDGGVARRVAVPADATTARPASVSSSSSERPARAAQPMANTPRDRRGPEGILFGADGSVCSSRFAGFSAGIHVPQHLTTVAPYDRRVPDGVASFPWHSRFPLPYYSVFSANAIQADGNMCRVDTPPTAWYARWACPTPDASATPVFTPVCMRRG